MSVLVPAALCAAVGIVWADAGLPSLIVPTIIAVALGVSLSVGSAAYERAAALLLAAGCGLLLGQAAVSASSVGAAPRTPLADAEVVAVLVRVDRVLTRGDGLILDVSLRETSSHAISADASGRARVLAALEPVPSRGEVVLIRTASGGGMWRTATGEVWIRAASLVRTGTYERWIDRRTAGTRERVRIATTEVAGLAGPLLTALLLGETDDLDPRVELLFRRAGVVHLLALSGMHLAVIALLARSLVRPVAGRQWGDLAALAASLVYTTIVGPRPGLVRAVLLVGAVLAMTAAERKRPLIELLSAAFLVQILLQPSASRQLGFWLSYLSLAGISLVAAPAAKRIQTWVPRALGSPLCAGLGAQVCTTPLLLAEFGRWYPAGVIASLVIGPIVLLTMSFGLLAVLIDLVGLAAVRAVSVPVLEFLYRAAEWTSWFFSAGPVVQPHATIPAVSIAAAIAALAVGLGLRFHYRNADAL